MLATKQPHQRSWGLSALNNTTQANFLSQAPFPNLWTTANPPLNIHLFTEGVTKT